MADSVSLINAPVLVLNQNYQPLNICNARRAFVLMGHGKAETVLNGRGNVRSATQTFLVPSVIRLYYMVKRPFIRRRLSRQGVFYRDRFTCQYCGNVTRELTLDHIKPRSREGVHDWHNVVSACIPCNHRKAGRTPMEADMRLRRLPTAPRPNPYYLFHHRHLLDEWRQFIPWVE